MKIKLRCKDSNRALYDKMLRQGGFEVCDEGDLTFVEDDFVPEYLIGKAGEDSVMLYLTDIVIIESYGREILARTSNGDFRLKDTLESLQNQLKSAGFIRISQSAIVRKKAIEKIRQGLSMRFTLLLKGGFRADVTRSYYYAFKEAIGL